MMRRIKACRGEWKLHYQYDSLSDEHFEDDWG